MVWFSDNIEFPPSLADKPWLHMLSVMGLLIGTLICVAWLHRLIAEAYDVRAPLRHPLSINRMITIIILTGALMRSLPNLVLVMCWRYLSPHSREMLAASNWGMNAVWAGLIIVAWWIDRTSRPVVMTQLRRAPALEVDGSLIGHKKQGVRVLVLVVIIAFATTFIKAGPANEQPALESRH